MSHIPPYPQQSRHFSPLVFGSSRLTLTRASRNLRAKKRDTVAAGTGQAATQHGRGDTSHKRGDGSGACVQGTSSWRGCRSAHPRSTRSERKRGWQSCCHLADAVVTVIRHVERPAVGRHRHAVRDRKTHGWGTGVGLAGRPTARRSPGDPAAREADDQDERGEGRQVLRQWHERPAARGAGAAWAAPGCGWRGSRRAD